MQRVGTAHLHVIAAWATQFLSKKFRNDGEPLAIVCPISLAQDLNLGPPDSRNKCVTTQPAKELISVDLSQRPIKCRALSELLSCVLISKSTSVQKSIIFLETGQTDGVVLHSINTERTNLCTFFSVV